jgi:thioredoxin 1
LREAGIFALVIVIASAGAFFLQCGCGEEQGGSVSDMQSEEVNIEEQAYYYQQPTGPSPSEIALENAILEGKPVFMNFHSDSCIPCIEMDKVMKEVEPEYEGRVQFIVVDVYDPAETQLCYDFQIRTIPTSIFFDSQGEITEGYEGYIDAVSLREIIDRLLGG